MPLQAASILPETALGSFGQNRSSLKRLCCVVASCCQLVAFAAVLKASKREANRQLDRRVQILDLSLPGFQGVEGAVEFAAHR
eukprot:11196477-Alexandrium_andersonii.AAC.1